MRYALWVIIGLLVWSPDARAADLAVLSGGAVRPGLTAAAAAYEAKSGNAVRLTFNSTPQIRKRLASGELFDVVIAPPGAMAEFVTAGRIVSEGVTIGRVGTGVVVRHGAPVPVISTSDHVKQAVLAAESVVFNRASSGQYIEDLMIRMDVWAQIKPKTTRYARSDEVMEHLLTGRGKEIGFGPITRILAYKKEGLVLVGPLPPDIQKLRAYQAAPMTASSNKDLAEAFIRFLVGSEGKPYFVAAGID